MGRKEDQINRIWENVRANMAHGSTFLRSRETAAGLAGTTLQSSIADAIFELDASAYDPVTSLGEGDAPLVTRDGARSPVRKGKLQQVEDLIRFYYGDEEREGFFAYAERLLPEPEV